VAQPSKPAILISSDQTASHLINFFDRDRACA
jgi:hypothetical protein